MTMTTGGRASLSRSSEQRPRVLPMKRAISRAAMFECILLVSHQFRTKSRTNTRGRMSHGTHKSTASQPIWFSTEFKTSQPRRCSWSGVAMRVATPYRSSAMASSTTLRLMLRSWTHRAIRLVVGLALKQRLTTRLIKGISVPLLAWLIGIVRIRLRRTFRSWKPL